MEHPVYDDDDDDGAFAAVENDPWLTWLRDKFSFDVPVNKGNQNDAVHVKVGLNLLRIIELVSK